MIRNSVSVLANLLLGTALASTLSTMVTATAAADCIISGADIDCIAAPLPAGLDDTQRFSGSFGSLQVTAGSGVDTRGVDYSAGTPMTPAEVPAGIVVVTDTDFTVVNDGLIGGGSAALYLIGTDGASLAVTNNGRIDGLLASGVLAFAEGDVVIANNNSVSGLVGISARSSNGSVTITTSAGSDTTGMTIAERPQLYGSPEVDGDPRFTGELQYQGGYAIDAVTGGQDLSIEIGADSTVSGHGGVLAQNNGTGDLTITTGARSVISTGAMIEVGGVSMPGGAGINALSFEDVQNVLIETGESSVVGTRDTASLGIALQSFGQGPTAIRVGNDASVGATGFGIINVTNSDRAEITTGTASTVEAGLIGIASVSSGGVETTDGEISDSGRRPEQIIAVGDSAHVTGGWVGISAQSLGGIVTIDTGANSEVVGLDTRDSAALPAEFASAAMPTLSAGILVMQSGLGDGHEVHITTGADSLVEGRGSFDPDTFPAGVNEDAIGSAILVTAAAVDPTGAGGSALVEIATGERSTVRGSNGFGLPGAGAVGTGISTHVAGTSSATSRIETGAGSLVEGGSAGISSIASAPFRGSLSEVITGDGSTVRAFGPTLRYELGDPESAYQSLTLPSVGIIASTFSGGEGSMARVVTGTDSIVEGNGFGIHATSGQYRSGVEIVTGDGSQVLSHAVLDAPQFLINGVPADPAVVLQSSGGLGNGAAIGVISLQFNELSNPAQQYPWLEALPDSEAGPVSITTGHESIVRGAQHGISVTTMMMSVDPWSPFANPEEQPGELQGLIDDMPKPRPGVAGTVHIIAQGEVTGEDGYGIFSQNLVNPAEITVDVAADGTVQGSIAGINAEHLHVEAPASAGEFEGRPILYDQRAGRLIVNNSGYVGNLSGNTDDLAIRTDNTAALIRNAGTVIGTVDLSAPSEVGPILVGPTQDDEGNPIDPIVIDIEIANPVMPEANHFINMQGGVWNSSGGENKFGTSFGDNTVVNEAGAFVVTADDAGTAQTTVFTDLQRFHNAGLIVLSDGGADDVTRLSGDFISEGGQLLLDTVLAADGSPSDILHVVGNTSAGTGPTAVVINNVGGGGAQTTGNGIKVIEVDGDSASNAFIMGGPHINAQGEAVAIAGAYSYGLFHNALEEEDGEWYLRSVGLNPDIPIYTALGALLTGLVDLPTLQQRVGNRHWADGGTKDGVPVTEREGFWIRTEAEAGHLGSDDAVSGAASYGIVSLQAGADKVLLDNDDGTLIGGASLIVAGLNATVQSDVGSGEVTASGLGIAGSLTWYQEDGLYIDAQAMLMATNARVSTGTTDVALTDGLSGGAYAVSVELGKRFAIDEELSSTPQLQVMASNGSVGDFVDDFGTSVSGVGEDRRRIRLGISVDKEIYGLGETDKDSRLHVYGVANLYYDLNDLPDVRIGYEGENEVAFTSDRDRFRAGLSLGASYNWNNDQNSIYGEATVSAGLSDPELNHSYKAVLGFRQRW